MSFATFLPDLIVGLATGVVVGAVIIGDERWLATKRDSAEASRHAARLVHPLLLAVQRLEEPNYESVLPLPRRIDRALTLVEKSDLDRWNEAGKNPDGSKNKFAKPLKDFPRRGFIGIQDHHKQVWIRNMKVRELNQ